MPKNEPDLSDPMELAGVAFEDPSGTSVSIMAECFADEFLNLGHAPQEVMELFRSSEHRLAHLAWQQLGEVRVFAIVHDIARRKLEMHERILRARQARGV
jgi:hypothetical protein